MSAPNCETPATIDADVGIVGAGPGGMAAALRIAEAGLSVVILDEGSRPGGQIFRQLPDGFVHANPPAEPPSHDAGHDLLHAISGATVRIEQRATVWDATPPRGDEPGRLWFEQGSASRLLRCKAIVLAPGALDRCVPFPGWTLPGVITAGAAQVMVRGYGIKPGARAVVAGSGPLLLPTVTALASAGVKVVAALEAAPRIAALRALPGVLRSGARLREAMFYARQLWRTGVTLQFSHAVFAAEGDGCVQRAVIGKLDREGNPIRSSAKSIDVDVVCTGYGLVPSIEIGQRLGCKAVWNEARGGWHIEALSFGATNVERVFAVGEIAGIGGSEVAIAEGHATGAMVAGILQQRPVLSALRDRATSVRRAADAMLRAFVVPKGVFSLAGDDTIVCRCEDVSAACVRDAARLHGDSLRAIKMGCRAGMGPCQGRICTPNVQAIATRGSCQQWDEPVAQVPLKPVRTQTILSAPTK